MRREGKNGGCLRALLIVGAILAGMLFIGIRAMAPVTWFRFNEKRIKELEQEYAISLDNAVPVRYWVPRMAQDTNDCFTFYTDDFNALMDTFSGLEIVRATEMTSGKHASYTCHVRDSFYYTVKFSLSDSKKGKYEGSLSSYTDPNSRPATSENKNKLDSDIIQWEYN
ncbi:MAG: hypothetical protein J5501_10590 [Ruminococcus sp.]|nr:hypothetical protein [Ruminococcus sp.]